MLPCIALLGGFTNYFMTKCICSTYTPSYICPWNIFRISLKHTADGAILLDIQVSHIAHGLIGMIHENASKEVKEAWHRGCWWCVWRNQKHFHCCCWWHCYHHSPHHISWYIWIKSFQLMFLHSKPKVGAEPASYASCGGSGDLDGLFRDFQIEWLLLSLFYPT